MDSKKFETKLTYYSKFDLLCIDEFLNYEIKECFLIQELLNRITLIKRCSLLVCSQVNPFDWVKLFPATGIGESARGRIMHISKSIVYVISPLVHKNEGSRINYPHE